MPLSGLRKTISIHAPLTGSDPADRIATRRRLGFQSTLPLRGATTATVPAIDGRTISIHAPLTGSDMKRGDLPFDVLNFNPRSPYGERHRAGAGNQRDGDFNPRSPYGERPSADRNIIIFSGISIHAPLTGSDISESIGLYRAYNFNPRSPYGERH